MRTVVSTMFLTLTLIMGALLFWQWNAYSKQEDQLKDKNKRVSQEVFVRTSANSLVVKQNLFALNVDEKYEVIFPEEASNWSCLDGDNKNCRMEDRERSIFVEVPNVTITYELPLNRDGGSFYLRNWLAKLKDVSPIKTKVEIAETDKRDSFWVTGGEFSGQEQLELIDYFVYQSKSPDIPLYWENRELTVTEVSENIFLYNYHGDSEIETIDLNFSDEDIDPFGILYTDRVEEVFEKGLMTTKDASSQDLQEKIVRQFLVQESDQKLNHAFYDLFSALINKSDPKSDKALAMLESLEASLDNNELDRLIKSVKNKEVKFNSEKLDEVLQSIKGLETEFFYLNNKNKAITPLFFYAKDDVFINGAESKIKVLVENNERLFPFIETMESFDFEVTHLDKQFLLLKDGALYRFYVDKNIFIYNEEDYGLLENPLEKVNDKVYIEEKWLDEIFDIEVTSGDGRINLSK